MPDDTKQHIKAPSDSCLYCKAKSQMFNLLTDDELGQVNDNRCRVTYRAGETIRKQGAKLSHVISVTGGLCKMYIEGVERHDIILRIIKPTNFIGGPGLYVDNRHHFTVSAITGVTVCFIDTATFRLVMEKNKAFADAFMHDMSKNMIAIYNRIISLTQKQMAGRIADALLYFSDEVFENRDFEIPLSKQDMADFTQMTRDNMVRILRSFHNEEIIHLDKEKVHIADYEKLVHISTTG